MSTGIPVPEGVIARRILQFFWIADYSGSMAAEDRHSQSGHPRGLPEVRKALASHPEVSVRCGRSSFGHRELACRTPTSSVGDGSSGRS